MRNCRVEKRARESRSYIPRENFRKKKREKSDPWGQQTAHLITGSDPLLTQARLYRNWDCWALWHYQKECQKIYQEEWSQIVRFFSSFLEEICGGGGIGRRYNKGDKLRVKVVCEDKSSCPLVWKLSQMSPEVSKTILHCEVQILVLCSVLISTFVDLIYKKSPHCWGFFSYRKLVKQSTNNTSLLRDKDQYTQTMLKNQVK